MKRGTKPKPIDADQVRTLASIQCTYDEIAAVMKLKKRQFIDRVNADPELREAIDEGWAHGRASIRRLQFKLLEAGNATMAVWLGKQHLGQRDQVESTLNATVHVDDPYATIESELLASLPASERTRILRKLNPDQIERLRFDWRFWARANQLPPAGEWRYWLVDAGRGFGKTRTGAELVRTWAKTHNYINLIGATADNARDIMIEGESGILAICPRDERPLYVPSKRRLEWPNGARTLIFTADEPDRLRGQQHEKLWCDEIASWRYAESWDQAKFGLRLGDNPQAVITTTPKPVRIVREILADPHTVVTRGTTYDNRANLPEAFFDSIISKYEGTRIGRQELLAELLEDVPGALWTRKMIDESRIRAEEIHWDKIARVVIAIDPAVTSREDSDETGIVVCAQTLSRHVLILSDRSLRATVNEWARAAVDAYGYFRADRIIAEVNNGGDLVEAAIRNVDPMCAYKAVHASRGKLIRAEPVSALYEQGRVHHVGALPDLEDQLCNWSPQSDEPSPDRMDALVWGVTELLVDNEPSSLAVQFGQPYRI